MAVKKSAKKSATKSAKTAAKKNVKKAVKKSVKKNIAKSAKKTAKKSVSAKSARPKAAAKGPKKSAKPVKKAAAKKSLKVAPKTKAPQAGSLAKKVAVAKEPLKKSTNVNLQDFITPLDNRILIRLTEVERRTAGGLYIPDTVADVSGNLQGHVVAVGRGHCDEKGRLHPLDVQVGDKVLFTQYSGSKIKIQNEDLIILRESELMGVVSK